MVGEEARRATLPFNAVSDGTRGLRKIPQENRKEGNGRVLVMSGTEHPGTHHVPLRAVGSGKNGGGDGDWSGAECGECGEGDAEESTRVGHEAKGG